MCVIRAVAIVVLIIFQWFIDANAQSRKDFPSRYYIYPIYFLIRNKTTKMGSASIETIIIIIIIVRHRSTRPDGVFQLARAR